MYITESLCYTPETNATLSINCSSIKKKIFNKISRWGPPLACGQVGAQGPSDSRPRLPG